MRRSKRRIATQTGDNALQYSTDDTEHEQTVDTTKNLAKKSQISKSKKPQLKKKDDKTPKENKSSTPVPRITRSRSKTRRRDTDYEGDVDTTTDSTSQSDSSTRSADLYDFDQGDEENVRLVLFPDSKKKTKTRKTKRNMSTKENRISRKPTPPKETATKILKESVTKPQALKSQSKGVKRKQSETVQISKVSKKVARPEISLMDSGVFMSPIERVRDTSLSTPDVTPIPTPSLSMSDCSIDVKVAVGDEIPRLEYDSLLELPPCLSPVKDSAIMSASFSPIRLQRSEPMDEGSPSFKSPIAEKTYSNRGQFMTPLERREKQKQQKARSKPRITSKRVEAWADKMNAEFAEIEMYDLSIEDQ